LRVPARHMNLWNNATGCGPKLQYSERPRQDAFAIEPEGTLPYNLTGIICF
jgi:hypothetical protein